MGNVIGQKRKLASVLSVITTLTGVALMIYMIKIEGELGALPLILIIIGVTWFIINRYKNRTH